MPGSNDPSLQLYKQLVDALVAETRAPVVARWIREWGPPVPTAYVTPPEFDAKMALFTAEQRSVMAELVAEAFASGMFYAIRDIEERCQLHAVVGVPGNTSLAPLPIEPFDNTLFQDFVGRRDGWDWPDEAR